MPIFKISGNKVQRVQPKTDTGNYKEKQLQKLIENNLQAIFDMTFIETEFSTTHGGRIDTLAIDSDLRPVIIEYKADKSSTILLQGLYYMDWLVENRAEFEKISKNRLKKELKINWSGGVRLILIAKSFEIWDKFAVNRIKEDVELYEYVLYENNELKLEKAALPKDFRGSAKTSITHIKEYPIEYQLKKIKDISVVNIVNDLRDRIKAISDDIQEKATKWGIIYKSSVNFAGIYTQKKQFWVDVKIPRKDVIKKFKHLDIRPHKDMLFTHVRWNKDTNLDELLALVELAFERTK